MPPWITWSGPHCNRANVDRGTMQEVVNLVTLPIERGNHDCTLPGSPQWVVSLESFLIPLREDMFAERYGFSFAEPSWSNWVDARLSECVVPVGDEYALHAARSFLNVATNIPWSNRHVYLCPLDDAHYI